MYPDLGGKGVLVTGAGKRIGRSISLAFAQEGARVLCADVNVPAAEETARLCGGRAVPVDVSDEASVERLFSLDEPVDVLVNNAGIYPNTPLLDLAAADWDRVFAINTRGAFLMTRAFARRQVARKAKGAVVCVSSVAGDTQARRGAAHYCASKAALNMLVRVSAIELGEHGIRVNAVAPGMIRDEVLHAPSSPDLKPFARAVLDSIPLRRSGSPDEVARAVVWLASAQAEWVTGAILPITGGAHAGASHLPLA